MNRLIQGNEVSVSKSALYAGTISSEVSVDFVQFTKVYQNLINIKQIIENPENCRVPSDVSERWATVAHMMEKIDGNNFGALATYANRFSLDFKLLFFRSIPIKHPKLVKHEAHRAAMVELSRYLYNS
jgi:hypothetical protein